MHEGAHGQRCWGPMTVCGMIEGHGPGLRRLLHAQQNGQPGVLERKAAEGHDPKADGAGAVHALDDEGGGGGRRRKGDAGKAVWKVGCG